MIELSCRFVTKKLNLPITFRRGTRIRASETTAQTAQTQQVNAMSGRFVPKGASKGTNFDTPKSAKATNDAVQPPPAALDSQASASVHVGASVSHNFFVIALSYSHCIARPDPEQQSRMLHA